MLTACAPPPGSAAGREGPPDLLLITVDTLRADRLPWENRGAAAPNIEALAARGARFTQATTPLPRTTPALASLHTGLRPERHGSREVGQPMGAAQTLAERLGEAGWVTVGVTANRVAGPGQGFKRGFDAFATTHDRPARQVARRALKLVDEAADPAAPLFLWVHFADPHFPYLPPTSFPHQPAARGCRGLIKEVNQRSLERVVLFSDRGGLASGALEDCRALYDAEIHYTDAGVGDLLAGLEARGRTQRAVTVLTSDHGENLGEEGLYFEHGPGLSDASLRVPLLIAGPGVAPRTVDEAPASLEDLFPTALALLGEAPPEVDGVDLSPRLGEDPPEVDRLALAESGSALQVQLTGWLVSGRADQRHCVNGPRFSLCQGPGEPPALFDHQADPELKVDLAARHPDEVAALAAAAARWPPEQARLRAARGARFKLVERPLIEGGYARTLYDLDADPGERHDVSELHPGPLAELTAALDAWTAALPPPLESERDSETVEALEALGYIEQGGGN